MKKVRVVILCADQIAKQVMRQLLPHHFQMTSNEPTKINGITRIVGFLEQTGLGLARGLKGVRSVHVDHKVGEQILPN